MSEYLEIILFWFQAKAWWDHAKQSLHSWKGLNPFQHCSKWLPQYLLFQSYVSLAEGWILHKLLLSRHH